MTLIDPGRQLAAALRAPVGREQAKARAGAASASASASGSSASRPSTAPAAPTSARRGPCTVSAAMAQRIAALAPHDPDRPRKAVRIYLEAELARAFGAALLNDPEFPALVDAVQQRLEEDAQTAGAAAALAKLLLAGAVRPT